MTVNELCRSLAYDMEIVIIQNRGRKKLFQGMAVEAMLNPDVNGRDVRAWNFNPENPENRIYV